MIGLQSSISASPQPTSYPQYLRKIGLVVSDKSGNGLDLSNMRIKFHTFAPDVVGGGVVPKTLVCRIYNLSDNTQNTIKNEFTQVMLQAGYQNGAYGIIFKGTIKRIKTGKETAIDTFLEIQAADGDLLKNYGFVNKTLSSGQTLQQQADSIASDMISKKAISSADTSALASTGGVVSLRGTVLFGLAGAHLDDIANSGNCSWFIEDGKLVFVSNDSYLPGDAIVLNSQTGLIGVPEATINGIEMTALLNPDLKCGRRVQINNAGLTQTENVGLGNFPGYNDLAFFASTSADGIYRVIVAEHEGDTRGNPWYSRLICLNIDASASTGSAVNPYG